MSKSCPIPANTHPRLQLARLRMMGSLRLQLFTQQVAAPARQAHLSTLANVLDRTAATRHAVDLAIVQWLRDWRETLQPKLIEQAVATLLDDEDIREVRGAGRAAAAFEEMAVRLATEEIGACLPQLRSAAERYRRTRLFVH